MYNTLTTRPHIFLALCVVLGVSRSVFSSEIRSGAIIHIFDGRKLRTVHWHVSVMQRQGKRGKERIFKQQQHTNLVNGCIVGRRCGKEVCKLV